MAQGSVVVLGGSGFVGSHVVARLSALGRRVIVPTRRRESAKPLILLPTVDVVEADVHDAAVLERLVRGAGAVVNLVGILDPVGRETFERVHVELARKLVAACTAAGVPRLLHMSALGAAAEAPSRYQRSKAEAEAIVTASSAAWTVFRPSVIFGPGDRFLNTFARLSATLPVIALAGAGSRFQPIHVGDVAHCFAQALTADLTVGARYDLCGPRAYTLRDLVSYAGAVTGNERPIVALGPALSRLQATVLEYLPGRLMSRDNLRSMQVDNVCACAFPAVFGIEPAALEAIAPLYLAPAARRSVFDVLRARSGR